MNVVFYDCSVEISKPVAMGSAMDIAQMEWPWVAPVEAALARIRQRKFLYLDVEVEATKGNNNSSNRKSSSKPNSMNKNEAFP